MQYKCNIFKFTATLTALKVVIGDMCVLSYSLIIISKYRIIWNIKMVGNYA